MDRMTSIATFVKIAETGGFAAAARKMGVSPSTVTTQIQDLEERLGARLLNRSTRKVSLTDIGRAYYERCMHILAEMEEADGAVRAMDAKPSGILHLNVSISIPFFVAPVIAEFTSLYPDVKVSMMLSDRIVDLIEERIDLAITTVPVPTSNLITRRVGSFRMLVCGSPDYFGRRGIPQVPDDLVNHNCIEYTFSPWGSEWAFKAPEGQRSIHVAGNMEANSVDALMLAATLGQGLIWLPDFIARNDIRAGRLVGVLTEFRCPDMPINAIYPHRQHLSTNVRSFLELVAKHVRATSQESVRLGAGNGLEQTIGALPSADLDRLSPKPARTKIKRLDPTGA